MGYKPWSHQESDTAEHLVLLPLKQVYNQYNIIILHMFICCVKEKGEVILGGSYL